MEAQSTQEFLGPLSWNTQIKDTPESLERFLSERPMGLGDSLGPGIPSSCSVSQKAADGDMVMEITTDQSGYQNSTDSSSTWNPENPLTSVSPRVPISKCADLLLSLEYRSESEKLLVSVIAARDVPEKTRSGMDAWQVHLVLLPAKKQRHKTSIQRGSLPHFNETFCFSRLETSDLVVSALRFRLYALGRRMSREHMMGEKVLRLNGINPDGGTKETTFVMEPRNNLKSLDSQLSLLAISQNHNAFSTQSLTHGGVPELLLGLSYNATTGRMSVEIVKGSHFRNLAINRPPDTYGRLVLLNSVGQEISRCKTSVRRGQPNPVFKETFVFQVALFQLSDVTLMVSIFNQCRMKRKEMVGWISLGQNNSGKEELIHWDDMKDNMGHQVCRWHVLLEA